MFHSLNVVCPQMQRVVFLEELNVLVRLVMDDHYARVTSNHSATPIYVLLETETNNFSSDYQRIWKISFYSIISMWTSSIVMFIVTRKIRKVDRDQDEYDGSLLPADQLFTIIDIMMTEYHSWWSFFL